MTRLRTAGEWASDQARRAWERGREALDAGDAACAITWLERACRYAPNDLMPKLSLATACLAAGAPEAAALFEAVAEGAGLREAWLGAAVAHDRAGRVGPAATALHRLLTGHAVGPAFPRALADRIAREAGFAGWCGMDVDDALILHGPGRARVLADGLALTLQSGATLPAASRIVLRHRPPLLGSPIERAAIRRTEGLVAGVDGGLEGWALEGWAWHPGDAARDPALTLVSGDRRHVLIATEPEAAAMRTLARPRIFRVSAAVLAGFADPIAVLDDTGRHLTGSPVFRNAQTRQATRRQRPPHPAQAVRAPDRAVAVVVPVFRGASETKRCLHQTLLTTPPGTVVIVVDDASPDAKLVALVDRLAAARRIRLVRHSTNRGFPAAANTGLRAALRLRPARDVVLLNSDTLPTPGWLARLRAVVQASADIGSATPLSNDGSIASYPQEGCPVPHGRALRRLAALAARANPGLAVDVPTGVGFCLYVRHECLTQTGFLRGDVFAQGYGEENDFCLRATAGGWRHVVVPSAYVAHVGGRSFGDARAALLGRNLSVLEQLHPGYSKTVAAWKKADTLAPARRRLDAARFLAAARAQQRTAPRGGVVLVTHDSGGGVERCVQGRSATLRAQGHWPIVLRPVLDPRETVEALDRRYRPGLLRLQDATAPDAYPNLIFAVAELNEVARLLQATRPAWLELHHLLGHDHAILNLAGRLGIPYDIRAHDYASFCARITLLGPADRYCGEPDLAGCVACVAAAGSLLEEKIGPEALHARSEGELLGARAVVVPSADMAARLRRHFPSVRAAIVPHERDANGAALPAGPARGVVRVAVVGAIGVAKGYHVLLGCARDAAARALALRFFVVGHTLDDEALFDTGCVDVTGPYHEGEAASLLARQRAHLAFMPSIWPETWCFTLGEVFAAGLAAVAFDLGAQAERIRRTGRGWLLPLGAPVATVNNCLIAMPRLAIAANVMQTTLRAHAGGE